jgi:hypothetical protein
MGHALMENRNGLAVDGTLTRLSGFAKSTAALAMASDLSTKGKTIGDDKAGITFTWLGQDDMDDVSGRVHAKRTPNSTLADHLYTHLGDDSGSTTRKEQLFPQPAKALPNTLENGSIGTRRSWSPFRT